jgi:hypothetical protein
MSAVRTPAPSLAALAERLGASTASACAQLALTLPRPRPPPFRCCNIIIVIVNVRPAIDCHSRPLDPLCPLHHSIIGTDFDDDDDDAAT